MSQGTDSVHEIKGPVHKLKAFGRKVLRLYSGEFGYHFALFGLDPEEKWIFYGLILAIIIVGEVFSQWFLVPYLWSVIQDISQWRTLHSPQNSCGDSQIDHLSRESARNNAVLPTRICDNASKQAFRTFPGSFLDEITSDRFWLPANISWNDVYRARESHYYPFARNDSVYMPFILASVIVLLRYATKRFIMRSLVTKTLQPIYSPEASSQGSESIQYIKKLHSFEDKKDVKDLHYLPKLRLQIQNEFDCKNRKYKPKRVSKTLVNKTCDLCWDALYSGFILCYGLWTLWDKPFVAHPRMFWEGYPFHPLAGEVYWYYTISMGHYLSAFLLHFNEPKRKDFWQMAFHHLATLCLLQFSWTTCFFRIGAFVLVIHDSSDIFLQGTKIANNLKFKRASEISFIMFFALWCVCRLYLYPDVALLSGIQDLIPLFGLWPGWYVFAFFLLALQLLNIVWSFFILRLLKNTLWDGLPRRDSRSPDSSDQEE